MNINSSNINLLADLSEFAIDQITNNDIIKEIPIFGSAVNIARATISLREKAFLNKIQLFISSIPEQSEEDKLRLIDEMEKDSKSRMKFGDAIFSAIEQADSLIKVEYLSIVFGAFIKNQISNRELRELCHSIKVSLVDDLVELMESEVKSERLMRGMVFTGLTGTLYKPAPLTHAGSVEIKPEFKFTKNGNILKHLINN